VLVAPPAGHSSLWAQAPEAIRRRLQQQQVDTHHNYHHHQQQPHGMLPETRSAPVLPKGGNASPIGQPHAAAAVCKPSGMSAANTVAVMAAASGAAYAAQQPGGAAAAGGRQELQVQPLRRHNSAPITTGEVVVSRQPSVTTHSVTTHGPTA
jgi:hypothetical protein